MALVISAPHIYRLAHSAFSSVSMPWRLLFPARLQGAPSAFQITP